MTSPAIQRRKAEGGGSRRRKAKGGGERGREKENDDVVQDFGEASGM
jgi:hypothetical protein